MNIKKLKELLAEKKITQSDLSEKIGVSQAFVSYMLKGYRIPSIAVIKSISEVLGVTVDDII